MRTTLAVLATSFLVLCPLAAQTHREEITVEVVDVPVYVFSSGKALRNLTKDDFELYVNGKRQQIDYFDRVDFSAPRPSNASPPGAVTAPEPARTPRERRLFLLLFDLVYNRPAALARCQKAAIAMIDHALPDDFFAVATTSSTEARFITSFTRDRDVLRRAVISLSPSRAHDSLAISITDAERQTAETWQPPNPGGGTSGGGRAAGLSAEDPVPEIMAAGAAMERERSKGFAGDQLADFSAIAARMTDLEGYKHVILFSEGFSSYLMTGAEANLGPGTVPDVDPLMLKRFQSMVQTFRASNVLFDTVDLGLPIAVSLDRNASIGSQDLDSLRNETLSMFAAQTGGQFIHNTNDLTGALADLSATCSVVYTLGFKPVNARKGANTIDVKLQNAPRGTTISFRKGFNSTYEKSTTIDPLRLADIIQNDMPQTGTPPVISFGERPFIEVVIPARQLAKEFGAITDAAILLYVFDAKGIAIVADQKKISIPAQPAGDIVVRQKLALAPGNYVAKSLLSVGTSIGFAKVAFTIPAQ